MKKFILSIIAIILVAINIKAQAPDFNFENWAAALPPTVTTENPVGWASFNVLTAFGMTPTVTKETVAPYSGTGISARIVTDVLPGGVSIKNPYEPGKNFDTVGMMAVGKTVFSTTAPVQYGFTIPAAFPRPTTLSFQCKYIPVAGDSAFVIAFLTKWSGTKRDTIATGKFATAALGAYTFN
ncbi:MAG: hypothetical protein H0W84_03445, partial [Bacteroidetes bacterium]|nr:hypothetical protein [Bacteroidota bacterium]